jgi:hypothetical protein
MRVLHLDRSTTRPGPVRRDARFPAVLHHDQFRADEKTGRTLADV